MKKSSFLILVSIMLSITLTATILISCDKKETKNKDLILPQANDDKDDKIVAVLPDKNISEPGTDSDVVENELPPESFVGTVVEEDTYYMVVEPNADEEEYEISKKIRVEYLHDHVDYLYGIGRKVVITYIPPITGGSTITTDDIRHDGFAEFELSVQYRQDSIPARFAEIQYAGLLTLVANNRDFDEDASDYNLYYYGLHDVYVKVDGDTLPLKEALHYGKITLDGLIAGCNWKYPAVSYDDGGSILYSCDGFKILKYHTLDGNRDIYIGTNDMDINAKNATAVCIGAYLWKDWGLRLEARDVSFDGATIVFDPFEADVTGRLQTGEAFWLEKMDGGKWVAVDTLPLIDYAFNMAAYGIDSDGETELRTDWHWLYGALGGGRYRIAKEVMDFRETGDFDKQIYYAYFEKPYGSDYITSDVMTTFSYEEDLEKYSNGNYSIKTDGFINNTMTLNAENTAVAVELAMRELGIDQVSMHSISYWCGINPENGEELHKIVFPGTTWHRFISEDENGNLVMTDNSDGSEIKTPTQTVYLNFDGITRLIVTENVYTNG
ncbi:MAG: hypothetical protein E7600_02820 [Ruminococcaceae bacterium]|nr:hypothetical protein [Oscillospiraceae bacterium]